MSELWFKYLRLGFFAGCVSLTFNQLVSVSYAQDTPVATGMSEHQLEDRLPTVRADVDVVLVPVTITNSRNQPVLGLERKDFKLFEDKRPQEIKYFSSEDAPMSIGLILDFSASMESKIDELRESVRQFFNNSNPEDEYFVVTVSSEPKLIASGKKSVRLIEDRLSREQPIGKTSLLDSIELMMKAMKKSRYERRAIVIVSDGGDNQSRSTLSRVAKEIEESNADVYAVGIFDEPLLFLKPLDTALGKRLLTRLTNATGGRTITVSNSAEVPNVFSAISLELRNRYVLGYRRPNGSQDGRWRKISVRLAPPRDKGQFQANYKKGYFALDN
jgi:Ca-activated chloride channel homolog